LRDPGVIERYAGTRQTRADTWRLRPLPAYCTRYPDDEICGTIGYIVDGEQMFVRFDMEYGLDALVNQCVNALMWSGEVRPAPIAR